VFDWKNKLSTAAGHNLRTASMISMFVLSGRSWEPRSGKTKDYEIGICCFSAKHAALRRKSYFSVINGFRKELIENIFS
jgi:hypothetical protein